MSDKILWEGGHAYFNEKAIADEVFGQHEDHIAFSPASQNTFNLENLILLVVVVKLSKTPEGIKVMERLAIKYIDSCTSIIESIQKSSSQNWLTALNNQHIAAGMMHRIGLLDDGAYIKILEHYRAVFDKMYVSETALAGLNSVTTMVSGGGGFEGIGALATTLKALMK